MNAETVDNRQSIIDWLGNEPNLEKYGIKSWEIDLSKAILEALKSSNKDIPLSFFDKRGFDQATIIKAIGVIDTIRSDYNRAKIQ